MDKMKNISRFKLIILVCMQLFFISSVCLANNLINGNFEQGISGSVAHWQVVAWTMENSIYTWEQSGGINNSRCISIDSRTLNDASWIQTIQLEPNTDYLVKGYIKGENIIVESHAWIGANFNIYDSFLSSDKLTSSGTFDWTEFKLPFKTDAYGSATIACRLGQKASVVTGKAYFDNISVIKDGSIPISNVQGLQDIQSNLAGSYYLANDIDCAETSNWNMGEGFIPLGSASESFNGTFSGEGHSIRHLTINRPGTQAVGLFGKAENAEIENVLLVDADMTGQQNTGGLAGEIKNTQLKYCGVMNAHIKGVNQNTAGMVGQAEGSSVTACFVMNTIVSGSDQAAGFIGFTTGSSISDSYVKDTLIIGQNICGGFIGNSFNQIETKNCYVNGKVIATGTKGAFAGIWDSQGIIDGCYWNSEMMGQYVSMDTGNLANVTGIVGTSDTEMKRQDTFAGWDFDGTWQMADYPVIRSLDLTSLYQTGLSVNVISTAPQAGSIVNYLIYCRNSGNLNAVDTVVSFELPEGLICNTSNPPYSSSQIVGMRQRLSWKIAYLKARESIKLEVSSLVPLNIASNSELRSRAIITATSYEKKLEDNICNAPVRTVTAPAQGDINVVPGGFINPGDWLHYMIPFTIPVSEPSEIVIQTVLPNGLDSTSITNISGNGVVETANRSITWQITDPVLTAGKLLGVSYSVKALAGLNAGVVITNSTSITTYPDSQIYQLTALSKVGSEEQLQRQNGLNRIAYEIAKIKAEIAMSTSVDQSTYQLKVNAVLNAYDIALKSLLSDQWSWLELKAVHINLVNLKEFFHNFGYNDFPIELVDSWLKKIEQELIPSMVALYPAKPFAIAGADFTIGSYSSFLSVVHLDGSQSYDVNPTESIKKYSWYDSSGTLVGTNMNQAVTVHFGDNYFSLVVNDGINDSDTINSNTATDSVVKVTVTDPHPGLEPIDTFEFYEAQNNNNLGLSWLPKKNKLFLPQRPTVVFIHGAGGAPNFQNTYWASPRFQEWNAGVFNWSGIINMPYYAYNGQASFLFNLLTKMIEQTDYNYTEIRLVGYSWGSHLASYAAKKLMRYIREKGLKILVSVDLLDPVNIASPGGFVTDDEGNTREGLAHIKENLLYVSGNQVVGLRPGAKLFTIAYEQFYLGVEFMRDLFSAIIANVEVFQDGETHNNFSKCPTYTYKECDWHVYDKVKVDTSVSFQPGPQKLSFGWLLWTSYYYYAHGPIFDTQLIDIYHTCYDWVSVPKSVEWGGYWKETGYYTIEWGGHWNTATFPWTWVPHYKTEAIYSWVWNYKTIYVLEWWAFPNTIHCGNWGWPHQDWHDKIWNGIQSRYY